MKKKLVLLVGILFSIFCLFATACSNEFAAQEYKTTKKLVKVTVLLQACLFIIK